MAFDLTEVEKRIEAVAGLSQTVTEGDDNWVLRRSYINRAQRDWAERFDWPQLFVNVTSNTSQSTGTATISLPSDYRKLATAVKFGTDIYPEVSLQERQRFNSTDKYLSIAGDPSNGYNILINPGTFASGTSIAFGYYRRAPSLVSGSDVSVIPNPDYLVQQALYYEFLANEDARFQDARQQAEQILANMLEFENTRGSGFHNSVLNEDRTKYNFRWGRN